MKKFKLLTKPVSIDHIQLDDLDYATAPIREEKVIRDRLRRWRRLRHQAV